VREGEEELIVDPSFASHFSLPGAGAHYEAEIAAALPPTGLLVANAQQLRGAVPVLGARMGFEFTQKVGATAGIVMCGTPQF
jgi:hypothetical protein